MPRCGSRCRLSASTDVFKSQGFCSGDLEKGLELGTSALMLRA